MTGRDLIIYILENHLEDEPVFKDGKLLGFMTVDEAAVQFDVGPETIKAWIALDYIPHIMIGEEFYISAKLVQELSKGVV